MAMAAASPVGILRSTAAFQPCVAPRRQAASRRFQLCAAPAHLRAMSRPAPRPSPRVAPRLRCATSDESASVAQDEEEYVVAPRLLCGPNAQDEEQYVLLEWAPSEEELDEFLALDMSPAAIRERFRRESVEARAAVAGAVAGVLRPLRDNFRDIRNLKYVHDTEEFHIGMPFGALMTCIGLYQLWKVAPNLCLDVAMPYAFYKLSVLAADVRRRGFSPDFIIRIKLALAVAMAMKDIHLKCTPLDYVRIPVYFMYTLSVMYDLCGIKKFAKYGLAAIIYDVICFFQNSKSMFDVPYVEPVAGAMVDGGPVQCAPEPDNSKLCGQKEGGETMQYLHEPAIAVEVLCGPKEGGETRQFLHQPASVIEVDNSSGVKEDGKLPHLASTSHPSNEEENVRIVSCKLSLNQEEEGEVPQFVAEPELPDH